MNTHSSTVSLTDNQQAAQERLETSEGRREFWRATVSCWLGTTMEYADFAL
ncbi:TPA: MFS transporter, partial [Escherichia coli]|nr:MFS transporter [Escherichia coli]